MGKAILDQLERFGPNRCEQLTYEQASAYAQQLAKTHYENFSVVSWLLPKRLRDDFRHVYAFCRWADDLGDETGDPALSLQLLDWWSQEIEACYADQPRHPVFVALHRTIKKHDIPRQPFDDLVNAFVQDQKVHRYDRWDQVLDYCQRSANPVGRLVLYLCGYRDDRRQGLSDATCTALQLANFWQDVRRDILERDRVYVPADVASKHGLDITTMVQAIKSDDKAHQASNGCCTRVPSVGINAIRPTYADTLKELVDRTWPMFTEGRELWPLIAPDVRVDIQLFTFGGESILKLIQRQGYDTLSDRPTLSKSAKLLLLLRALTGKAYQSCFGRGVSDEGSLVRGESGEGRVWRGGD